MRGKFCESDCSCKRHNPNPPSREELLKAKRERMAEFREREPRRVLDARLRCAFNIDIDCYESMLKAQNFGCAICGATEPGGKGKFHVDHDRSCCPTKRSCGICVRGLLCTRCNVGIAMFRDSIKSLENAISYVRR